MILSFKTAASKDLTICNWISGRVVSPWKQSQMVSMARSMRGACSAPSWATVRCKGAEKYEYEMSLPMQSRAVVVRGIVPDLVASCNGAKTISGSGSSLWFSLMASRASLTSSASCLFLPAFAAMMSSESDTTFWRELMVGLGFGFGWRDRGRPVSRRAQRMEGGFAVVGGFQGLCRVVVERGGVCVRQPYLDSSCVPSVSLRVRDAGRRVPGRLGFGWLQRGRWLRCRGICILRRGQGKESRGLPRSAGKEQGGTGDGARWSLSRLAFGICWRWTGIPERKLTAKPSSSSGPAA